MKVTVRQINSALNVCEHPKFKHLFEGSPEFKECLNLLLENCLREKVQDFRVPETIGESILELSSCFETGRIVGLFGKGRRR